MSDSLSELRDLDQTLLSLLNEDEINSEEILKLVDKREQLLQNVVNKYNAVSGFKESPEWREAIERTRKIVLLMQSKTKQLGEALRKYRHGNKSVQRYQQFL